MLWLRSVCISYLPDLSIPRLPGHAHFDRLIHLARADYDAADRFVRSDLLSLRALVLVQDLACGVLEVLGRYAVRQWLFKMEVRCRQAVVAH